MSNGGRKTFGALVVFAVAFALFCFWFLFSYTGAGHRAEVRMNAIMPRWLVVANFLVLPCVTAIAAGPLRVRPGLRLVLMTLALPSILILQVSFRKLPIDSCAVLAVLLLEVYWIVPRWNARRRRVGAAGGNEG